MYSSHLPLVIRVGTWALLPAMASMASAASINVDFNAGGGTTYVGRGASSDTGTVWNGIAGATGAGGFTSGDLVSTTGSATGITLTMSANLQGMDTDSDFSNTGAMELMRDGSIADGSTTGSVTFNNLPDGFYSFYLYEDRGNVGEETKFTIDGISQISSGDDPSTPGFNSPEDYVLFTGFRPDAQHKIEVDFIGATSQKGAINGVQISGGGGSSPEPTSSILVLMGLGCFLPRRPRRA